MLRRPPRSTRTDTLLPYTTLFRSHAFHERRKIDVIRNCHAPLPCMTGKAGATPDFIVDRPYVPKATPSPGKGNMTARTAGIFPGPYKRDKNEREQQDGGEYDRRHEDRKSTRLNSRP